MKKRVLAWVLVGLLTLNLASCAKPNTPPSSTDSTTSQTQDQTHPSTTDPISPTNPTDPTDPTDPTGPTDPNIPQDPEEPGPTDDPDTPPDISELPQNPNNPDPGEEPPPKEDPPYTSDFGNTVPQPNLQLLYDFPIPADQPKAPGDVYAPPALATGNGAPVIRGITAQVNPGNSVTMQGEGFGASDQQIYVFTQGAEEDGTLYRPQLPDAGDTSLSLIMDEAYDYSMYLVWSKKGSSYSKPIRINQPQLWWLSDTTVEPGQRLSVYGANLSHLNGTTESHVYIREKGADKNTRSTEIKVLKVDPYRVTCLLPSNLPTGKEYELWVHNGHGGDYGWAEPLSFTAVKTEQTQPKIINVKTVGGAKGDGVTDDTMAIMTAFDEANAGDVVYFPAGTYVVSSAIYINQAVTIRGEKKETTKILTAASFTDSKQSVFNITTFPTVIDSLSFVDDKPQGSTPMMLSIRGRQAGGDQGVTIQNCIISKRERQVTPSYPEISTCIDAQNMSYLTITDSIFVCAKALTVTRSSKITITNNTFYGNAGQQKTNGPILVVFSVCDYVDMSENFMTGLDQDGTIELGDYTLTRGITFGGGQGAATGVYLARNVITKAGNPEDNSGEQIMFEYPLAHYYGPVASAKDQTVSFTDSSYTISTVGDIIAITGGKGQGQYRVITAVDKGSVTVDRPWNIVPDSTSRVIISDMFTDMAIYRNTIEGFDNYYKVFNASAGIQAYGNTINTFVTRNSFSKLMTGIQFWAHYTSKTDHHALSFWTIIDNNTIRQTRYGVLLRFYYNDGQSPTSVPASYILHTAIRNNAIYESRLSAAVNLAGIGGNAILIGSLKTGDFADWPETDTYEADWISATLVENNRLAEAEAAYILLMKHQGHTILRGNTISGSGADTRAIVREKYAGKDIVTDLPSTAKEVLP